MKETGRKRPRRGAFQTVQNALNLSSLSLGSCDDDTRISDRLSIRNKSFFVVRYYTSKQVVGTSVPEESVKDAGVPVAREMSLLAWMLDLTRTNMKSMYEACPGWGWDDTGKRAEFEHQDARFLVVFDMKKNETPVAFAHIRYEIEEGLPILYVYELQVCTSSQGCGLGRWLMQHVQAIARDRELSRIMLTVFSSNTNAINFYRNLEYSVDPSSPIQVEIDAQGRTTVGTEEAEEGYFILSKKVLPLQ